MKVLPTPTGPDKMTDSPAASQRRAARSRMAAAGMPGLALKSKPSAYVPGSGWQPDQQVPNVGMSGSPSAVVYGGYLYVFHQGADQNGQLWYSTYVPGSGWQPDTQVPSVVGMSESPSAVVWNGDLHVFHQGIGEDGQLWFAYFDGTNWHPEQQVPTVGMSQSPAMLATT